MAAAKVGAAAPSARPDKPATIYDVAKLAGVSHQTVSRWLKGDRSLRPATRERVEQALADTGYRPNQTARLLARNRPHRIAAFTHEISQVGPSRIAQGASAGAREAGYVLDIVTLDAGDRRSIEEAIELFDRPDVAGILALVSTDEVVEAFGRAHPRVRALVVTEADDVVGGAAESVSARAMALAVGHLGDHGHRRFVHVAGPSDWSVARNREEACRREVERRGFELVGVLHGNWSASSAYDAVLRSDELAGATAWVCANDQMAIGTMAALRDRGLDVPGSASVVGIDDIPEARYLRPALTTVHLEFEDQGRHSIERLVAMIEDREVPTEPEPSAQLMVRGSVGPAPRR